MGFVVRDVHFRENRLQVRVDHEGCNRDEFSVRELEWRPGLREDVNVLDEVLAHAELFVAHERILRLKATEAPLATEVAAIMLGNVAH